MGATADKVILGEPFQWHLPTSAHDVTPCCRTGASNLGSSTRLCKGCGAVYRLPVRVSAWLPVARRLGEARRQLDAAENEMRMLLKPPEAGPALCEECGLPEDEHHEFHKEPPHQH